MRLVGRDGRHPFGVPDNNREDSDALQSDGCRGVGPGWQSVGNPRREQDISLTMRQFQISAYDTLGYLATGYALLFLLDTALGFHIMRTQDPALGNAVFSAVLAYVVGHVSSFFSYFFEKQFVERQHTPPESDPSTGDSWKGWARAVGLHDETLRRIVDRIVEKDIRETGRDLFYRVEAIVRRSEVVSNRLTTFLVLYGFCRNMAAVLLVSGTVFLGRAVCEVRAPDTEVAAYSALAALVCWFGTYAMHYRYRKFYVAYMATLYKVFAEGDEPGGNPPNRQPVPRNKPPD